MAGLPEDDFNKGLLARGKVELRRSIKAEAVWDGDVVMPRGNSR
jgi:hypothetical protein